MIIEPIGFYVLLAGIFVLYKGPELGVYVLAFAMLLGAAAAVKLPALGDASIMPAHALLPFYFLAVAQARGGVARIFDSLIFPKPGFWLAAFTIFGVITAVFLPRIFAGSTDVFSLARYASERTGIVISPLAPQTSNITQSVYLLGNLTLFAALYAHINGGGKRYVVGALLFAGGANLAFAFIDILTYVTGTTEFLDFIRNANFSMLTGSSIGSFKRIVGSFPEASAFGGVTTFFFVFCCELWLRGYHGRAPGWIAFISFALLILSTSSAAYLGLGIYGALLLARCVFNLIVGVASPRHSFIALGGPAVALLLLTGLMLIPHLWTALMELADAAFTTKLGSRSGIERVGWNIQGLKAFFDTYMFGAGVGSVRTSSLFVSLLANVGVIGTALFTVFLLMLLNSSRTGKKIEVEPVIGAAVWTCSIALVPAAVAGTSLDLGMIFFAFAALATAVGYMEKSEVASRCDPVTVCQSEVLKLTKDGRWSTAPARYIRRTK